MSAETSYRTLVETIARAMVSEKDQVSVLEISKTDGHVVLELDVADKDVGRIIGRKGKNAQALRTILAATGAVDNVRVILELKGDRRNGEANSEE